MPETPQTITAPEADIASSPFPAHEPTDATRHSLAEDGLAIASGTLLIGLGVALFNAAGLLTGGTAGLAFLGHYASGQSFGLLFFLINLPFYWLAWRKMGGAFTVKTFLAVGLVSLITTWQPLFLSFDALNPVYAALIGGLVTGTGFLILFRHKCSLGGVGILALWLQERWGWRAGKVQMGVDCTIVLLALMTVEPSRVALSILGAVALNLVLAMNHKPGRYLGF